MTILWGTLRGCRATFVDVVSCSSSSAASPSIAGPSKISTPASMNGGCSSPPGSGRGSSCSGFPTFFLSYLGLLLLPFGLVWSIAGARRLGRPADDGLRRPRRRALRAVAVALGEQLLGPVRDDVPVRDELRVLAVSPQRPPRPLPGGRAATPTCTSACCSPSIPARPTGTRRWGGSS